MTENPSPPKKVPSSRPRVWTHVHLIGLLLGVAMLAGLTTSSLLFFYVRLDVPAIHSLESYTPKLATLILDRRGVEVERIGTENRRLVSLAGMPRLLPLAFVAAEDARFFSHRGVDGWSIARALVHNLMAGAKSQGGSTITQQVTRSLLLSRRKDYSRKLKEAILAYRIDRLLTKEEILQIYLNEIYLGDGAYGVEAAARTYFDKPVPDLTLAEVAMLAGLPQAPSRYSPLKNPEAARARQMYVLNRMAEEGYITPEEAREAYGLELRPTGRPASRGGEYFLQYVRNYLERRYGAERLMEAGFTVHTTLDRDIQAAAEAAVRLGIEGMAGREGAADSPQAALVALEVQTGRVAAMAGGIDFAASQFDRASQARRQPGSAFKPIIYAAALEAGLTQETILEDTPLRLPGEGGGSWSPANFDHTYLGPVSLRQALAQSRNVVAVRLLRRVTIPRVVELAGKMGINSPLTADLSLALGSSGVSLLELTGAYTAFANQGRHLEPWFIEQVGDRTGAVLEEHRPAPRRVFSERTAAAMDDMLRAVVTEGTGSRAGGLKARVAGKTGTTDRNLDAWFVGYTPTLVAGVWVGHDRPRSLGRGATGGGVAAPIWRDFMARTAGESTH